MGVSPERLAEVDEALAGLGKGEDEITAIRARVRAETRELPAIDETLAALFDSNTEALLTRVREGFVSSLGEEEPPESDVAAEELAPDEPSLDVAPTPAEELEALLDNDEDPSTDEHLAVPVAEAVSAESLDEVDALVDAVMDESAVPGDSPPPADHLLEDASGLPEDELFDSEPPKGAGDYSAYLVDSDLPGPPDEPLAAGDEDDTVMLSADASLLTTDSLAADMADALEPEGDLVDETSVFSEKDVASMERNSEPPQEASGRTEDSTIPFTPPSSLPPAPSQSNVADSTIRFATNSSPILPPVQEPFSASGLPAAEPEPADAAALDAALVDDDEIEVLDDDEFELLLDDDLGVSVEVDLEEPEAPEDGSRKSFFKKIFGND